MKPTPSELYRNISSLSRFYDTQFQSGVAFSASDPNGNGKWLAPDFHLVFIPVY